MSTATTSKRLELAAIVVGVVAIAASAYFIFTQEGAFRLTNWVISLAFLVFVAYNFINVRALKERIGDLEERNSDLTSNLERTRADLTSTQSELTSVRGELTEVRTEAEAKVRRIQLLEDQLAEAKAQAEAAKGEE